MFWRHITFCDTWKKKLVTSWHFVPPEKKNCRRHGILCPLKKKMSTSLHFVPPEKKNCRYKNFTQICDQLSRNFVTSKNCCSFGHNFLSFCDDLVKFDKKTYRSKYVVQDTWKLYFVTNSRFSIFNIWQAGACCWQKSNKLKMQRENGMWRGLFCCTIHHCHWSQHDQKNGENAIKKIVLWWRAILRQFCLRNGVLLQEFNLRVWVSTKIIGVLR